MPNLLCVHTSPRFQGSRTRQLTQAFVQEWQIQTPNSSITYRDLAVLPIPLVDDLWVEAYETEPDQRSPLLKDVLALSDQLIDELEAADHYVFGLPMYNLTVPASFKAYLDQVIRRDRTLKLPGGAGVTGLQGKKALVIGTRKFDYSPSVEAASRNFFEPYLQAILGLIGIQDLEFAIAENLAKDPETAHQNLETTMQRLKQMAAYW